MLKDSANALNILIIDPTALKLEREPTVNGFSLHLTKVKNANEAVQALMHAPCSLMFYNAIPSSEVARNVVKIRKVRSPEVFPIIALGDGTAAKKKEFLDSGFDDLLLSPLTVAHIENKARGWAPFLIKHDTSVVPYNLEIILEIIRAEHISKGFFNLLLDELTNSLNEITEQIRLAYSAGDVKSATNLLHKLRSTFGSVGAMEIVSQTSEMEEAALDTGTLNSSQLERLLKETSRSLSDFRELQILFP